MDEFASYFNGDVKPRVVMTTSKSPSVEAIVAVKEMLRVFPNSEYVKRKNFDIKPIVRGAIKREYTDVLIWEESALGKKGIDSLILIHLPNGPTARFRVTSLVLPTELRGHGRPTKHYPELVLNRFDARLGRTVSVRSFVIRPFVPLTASVARRWVACWRRCFRKHQSFLAVAL